MSACRACGRENRAGARFCDACGAPLAAAPAPERRKLATLLFCDMSGSTAMGERVDAESVRDLMFRYFHEMRSAIERHGGTVEKFVGDAVMAVFGVPVAHEDDALRAVRAATEMQERMGELNTELEQRFGTRIALRIGLNTGEVVAGDVTSRETIVTGDAVNVAARLEQTAQPGDVLLGELTYHLVKGAASVEPVAPLALKGKAEPVPAFRLLALAAREPAHARRLETPMVGRRDELALLADTFARAVAERRCRLVTVLGEPGVGKSRLGAELADALAGEATVLRGRFLPYGEGITYWPVAEIVREAAAIRDEDSHEEAQEKIGGLVVTEADGSLVAQRVAQAIGLAGGAAPAEEIAWGIRRLLEALARRRPLLLLLDDLQWAEPALLDVLTSLPALVRDAPLVCLSLARPELLEVRPEWEATVRLEPLGEGEGGELVERLLGSRRLPLALGERVRRTAGGNPLFAEELVALVAEGGGEANELPPTLSSLLGARLDRLATGERSTLERGAIEGEVFHRGAVAELSPPGERASLSAQLEALAGKEFLRPARAGFADEAAFRFRHILIRDAVYGGMSKRLRAELHQRFAAWLERRSSEYDEIVGYHLEQAFRYRTELGPADREANDLARAAGKRLAAAGRRAYLRGDTPAAVSLLGRATQLLPADDRLRLELLTELGAALFEAGELSRARAVLSEAAHSGVEPIASRASIQRAMLESYTDADFGAEDARAEVEAAIAAFERHGDDQGLARAWLFLGEIHNFLGHRRAMEIAAERSAEHARKAGDHRAEADALRLFGGALVYGPTPAPEAIARLEGMLAGGTPNRMVEAALVAPLAALRAMGGEPEEGRRLIERARAIYHDLGLTYQLARLGFMSGRVERLAGDLDAAERELRHSCELLEQLGERGRLGGMALELANVLCDRDNLDEAEVYLRLSEELLGPDEAERDSLLLSVRGRVLTRRSDPDGEALAREAVRRSAATDDLTLRSEAVANLAEALLVGGRRDEARRVLEEAAQLGTTKGNIVLATRSRALLEQLGAGV